jgi:hypothetical protein
LAACGLSVRSRRSKPNSSMINHSTRVQYLSRVGRLWSANAAVRSNSRSAPYPGAVGIGGDDLTVGLPDRVRGSGDRLPSITTRRPWPAAVSQLTIRLGSLYFAGETGEINGIRGRGAKLAASRELSAARSLRLNDLADDDGERIIRSPHLARVEKLRVVLPRSIDLTWLLESLSGKPRPL